jgi:hypothetical protein
VNVRCSFTDHQTLRLGDDARISQILAILSFVEIGRADGELSVLITPQTLSNALARGLEGDVMRRRLEELAPLPEPAARTLAQASAVIGRVEHVPSAGFVWVDDPELRQLLQTRRQTAELFIDPSPPGGLLLAPGVDLERLVVRCRSLGIDVMGDGGARRLTVAEPDAPSDSESQPSARSTMRRHSSV